MGKSKCRCGNSIFETVDITPVGMVEKKTFTRCSKCGLVVAGSDNQSEKKNKTSKSSILRIVRDSLERDK